MLATLFTWATTILSLTGTVLNVKKIRACFYIWVVANLLWLAWDISQGLWSRALLDVVQTAFAVWGIIEWRDKAGDA